MGLSDETVEEKMIKPSADTSGIILFANNDIDTDKLARCVTERFGEGTVCDIDKSRPNCVFIGVKLEDVEFWCSYMNAPFPDEDGAIKRLLGVNAFVSPQEKEEMLRHQSFMFVAQKGKCVNLEEKRRVCMLFNELCGEWMKLDETIGLLNSVDAYVSKRFYLNELMVLEENKMDPDYFPALLWVLIYPSMEGEAHTVETLGLKQFGFPELMFYDPKQPMEEVYDKLSIMCMLEITEQEFYQNRDTISFTPDSLTIFKQVGDKLALIGDI